MRILDEAFGSIATAKANTEKNLQNARALFESYLQAVFTQPGEIDSLSLRDLTASPSVKSSEDHAERPRVPTGEVSQRVTQTGGREATQRHISGMFSLAVGMPETPARNGWTWSALSELARLESGHTPSRRHPEYWGGSIPWISIQDAREHHGYRIFETFEYTNEEGIAHSSARILPKDTVCLSRTASVGYVAVMGRPMATSQDFVNWVCADRLNPEFLKYVLLAEGKHLLRFSSGAVHQTIYFPEAKAFHVCHPGLTEQARIVAALDTLREHSKHLESIYQKKLAALVELKKSLLHHAFTGNL